MRKLLLVLVVCGLSAYAYADIIWDQSNIDTSQAALVDQDFSDYPTYSSFMATDISTTQNWIVQKVTTYFTAGYGSWPVGQNVQAKLNIIPRDGCNLPGNQYDPSQGTVVNAQLQHLGNALALVASGLNINLPAGDYWVGLTPMLAFGTYGQEFHYGAPIVNCNTAWRNPGGSFGYGTNWTWAYSLGYWQNTHDAAIKIEGIPEPASMLLLGLAGLLIRRR